MFKTISTLAAFGTAALICAQAYAAPVSPSRTESAYTSVEPEQKRMLEYVQLSPMLGFTAIDSTAGFNIGTHAAFRLMHQAPLYAEPSLFIGAYSSRVQFNFGAGLRYDLEIPDTKVRPLVRASLGPTLQTSGSTAVFNAFFGAGAMFPIRDNMDFRAELGLVDIDGNAGVQFLTGVAL